MTPGNSTARWSSNGSTSRRDSIFSPEWNSTHDELLREGYVYLGVTPQYIGALALKGWEAGQPGDRYATIFHPGDSFAYDIFSQVGRAITRPRTGSA